MEETIDALSDQRLTAMLTTALGEHIGRLLLDQSIIELMVNPDGKLWIDRLGEGRTFTGYSLSPVDVERVIFIVASSVGSVCSKDYPLLSAELPSTGSRFQGVLPPIVQRPSFTIRKKAIKIFTLDDYVRQDILSDIHAKFLRNAIAASQNILIVGGTGSGKTTLANAILELISQSGDRVIIIEDTQELQCKAQDTVALRTKESQITMTDLLKATMRLRPDRIVIGEVRGREALDLLKAWNTGHPGGCATIHADSAAKGLIRLEQLVQEAGVECSKQLIAEAVNVLVHIKKVGLGRKVQEILTVKGVKSGEYLFEIIPAQIVSR